MLFVRRVLPNAGKTNTCSTFRRHFLQIKGGPTTAPLLQMVINTDLAAASGRRDEGVVVRVCDRLENVKAIPQCSQYRSSNLPTRRRRLSERKGNRNNQRYAHRGRQI